MEFPESNEVSRVGTGGITSEELWALLPSLLSFLAAKGLAAEEAEDLAQETLSAAWNGRHRFRNDASLSTWVFAIAKKQWLQRHRARRRLKRKGIEVDLVEFGGSVGRSAVLRARDAGPEDRLLARERVRVVQGALSRMPEKMSAALVLHVYQGRSYREIARLLRADVNKVSSLIYQARQKLRQLDWSASDHGELKSG